MSHPIANEPREQPVLIVLADISGYTKFMVENHLSAVHGQMVITSLIEALLREVDIPLELQEIEGDAVFLYATCADGQPAAWDDVVRQVRTKLPRFFEAFVEARAGIGELTACKCAICTHADELALKVIVHAGRAVFHAIGSRLQVSGTDVILAHRLLKNSVPGSEYLLLSEAAHRELGAELGLELQQGSERYESLGEVRTYVHFLSGTVHEAVEAFYKRDPEGDPELIREYVRWGMRHHLSAALRQLVRPTSRAGWVHRALFLVGSLLYAPILLRRYPRQVAAQLDRKRAQRAQEVGTP